MPTLLRTSSTNPDFIQLVKLLDKELAERDGDEHPFYDQFNKIDNIRYVVIAYEKEKAVACGAIKEYAPGIMEIKRMFTDPGVRGKGVATSVLNELIQWAKELNYHKCILETGIRQPDAIRLYQKNGFTSIPNYGQYEGVVNSVCFEIELV
jgi:putative acetyltransferase